VNFICAKGNQTATLLKYPCGKIKEYGNVAIIPKDLQYLMTDLG
jgi:hypothetical protein